MARGEARGVGVRSGDLSSLNPTGEEFIASERLWHKCSRPKVSVLGLRAAASMRVRNGELELG